MKKVCRDVESTIWSDSKNEIRADRRDSAVTVSHDST